MWALFVGWVFAADWLVIQGSEIGRPDAAVSLGGFVQVDATLDVFSRPVDGVADHEGDYPALGGPPVPWVALQRARPIVRGAVPNTDQRVAYFLGIEFGQNAVTRKAPVALMDASVSFRLGEGMVARVGRFKLPITEESLEANPTAGELIAFSEPVRYLVVENPIAAGAYTGGSNGYRDQGLELFGWVDRGRWRLEAVGMVGNGAPTVDRFVDATARVRVVRALADGVAATNPHRPEVAAWAWGQGGRRESDGVAYDRLRFGVGVGFETAHARLLVEGVHARGGVDVGAPFVGDPIPVDVDGVGYGLSATARWSSGKVAAALRVSGVSVGEGPSTQQIGSLTPGIRYDPFPHVQVEVNYEARYVAAPHGDAAARAIAAAAGDRVLGSATVVF